jgi:D-cysteine desulfhydrase/L-cysteate sulfo-lyase
MFDQIEARLPALAKHRRVNLGVEPTAIETLDRLGNELGISLFVKRDDCLPLAMGGNKHRQLEYYFGQAADHNADTVLITGAIQSNFVRLCAAAARKIGWHPVVQLEDRVPNRDHAYNNSGNVLINRMLGADLHYFHEGGNEAAADASLDNLAEIERSKGRTPYVIHLGIDHPPFGAMGYVACAVETRIQCERQGIEPNHIIIPSGSGLTHSGFLAGARAVGWDVSVHGICVRRNCEFQRPRIERRYREVLECLDVGEQFDTNDVRVDDTVLAPGYGQLNDGVAEAIRLAAQCEGLLVDPVYSGRTLAGLISLVRNSIIKPHEKVLLIHTGGGPALFGYENKLQSWL